MTALLEDHVAQLSSFPMKAALAVSTWCKRSGCGETWTIIWDGGTQTNSSSESRVLTQYPKPAFTRSDLALNTHSQGTGGSSERGKGNLFLPETHSTAITPRHQSSGLTAGWKLLANTDLWECTKAGWRLRTVLCVPVEATDRMKLWFVEEWKKPPTKLQLTPQGVHHLHMVPWGLKASPAASFGRIKGDSNSQKLQHLGVSPSPDSTQTQWVPTAVALDSAEVQGHDFPSETSLTLHLSIIL